jgi:hypothetical protein
MNDHGWIDNGGEGQKVCPGDYLKKDNNLYYNKRKYNEQ